MTLQYKGTLLSLLSFFVACLLISAVFEFFEDFLYYSVGLLFYLPLFAIPSLIYERKTDLRIAYMLIVTLWIIAFVFTFVYISVHGVGGSAGKVIRHIWHEYQGYENIKALFIASFPYFIYVVVFLALQRLKKETMIGGVGYGILAAILYFL